MKRVLVILVATSFWGCGGFLDEVDQDLLVPEKPDHFAALLLKEFNREYPIFRTVDYMTDNMTEIASMSSKSKKAQKTTYTWQREIEIDEEGERVFQINNAWQNAYEDIAIANYVIELIDVSDGDQDEKDYIKGEACFIRALSYFNLLNLYGKPFDPATEDADLGVPLRTNVAIEKVYYRNTVSECYQQIENDIVDAVDLIEGSGIEKSKWHPDARTCKLLMSRVKLYQQKWDEAIVYASEVIDEAYLSRIYQGKAFITDDNDEVLYSFYTVNPVMSIYSYDGSINQMSYSASEELYNLYDSLDQRREAFFSVEVLGPDTYYHPTKYSNMFTKLGYGNFRVAEAYLNRAEAYAQLDDVTGAIEDIRSILLYRYTDASGIVYPASNPEVLDFILTERRKELCFEDHHRWFDLRRMEDQPEIKHAFTLVDIFGATYGKEIYTLLPGDNNYTLSIPLKEREINPLIRNNDRFEKIPEMVNR
ncbi:MAG: RagB/SusD family nutrient uptake outer membrane protein [Bacteroidota bacterium]